MSRKFINFSADIVLATRKINRKVNDFCDSHIFAIGASVVTIVMVAMLTISIRFNPQKSMPFNLRDIWAVAAEHYSFSNGIENILTAVIMLISFVLVVVLGFSLIAGIVALCSKIDVAYSRYKKNVLKVANAKSRKK